MTLVRRRDRTDTGTVVNVYTRTAGDELAPGVPGQTNLITFAALTVTGGAIDGWAQQNVTVSGPSGGPTVTPTDPTQFAWLRSPAFPVTAGESYAAAVNVGNEATTVALLLPGQVTEVTSSGRVPVSGVASVSGSGYLEIRWWPRVSAGYGSGLFNAGSYGG